MNSLSSTKTPCTAPISTATLPPGAGTGNLSATIRSSRTGENGTCFTSGLRGFEVARRIDTRRGGVSPEQSNKTGSGASTSNPPAPVDQGRHHGGSMKHLLEYSPIERRQGDRRKQSVLDRITGLALALTALYFGAHLVAWLLRAKGVN